MKLVEIKDIRFGQIRKNFDDTILIVEIKSDGFSYYKKYDRFGNLTNTDVKLNIKFLDMPIVGFLGITHKIEDNKLVEIPRDEFETDDIFQAIVYTKSSLDPTFDIGCDFKEIVGVIRFAEDESGIVFDYDGNEYKKDELEKIGILGVTHEFINERLVK